MITSVLWNISSCDVSLSPSPPPPLSFSLSHSLSLSLSLCLSVCLSVSLSPLSCLSLLKNSSLLVSIKDDEVVIHATRLAQNIG